jgi:hypothetical protein
MNRLSGDSCVFTDRGSGYFWCEDFLDFVFGVHVFIYEVADVEA